MEILLKQIKDALATHSTRQAFCFLDTFYSYRDLSNQISKIVNLLTRKIPDTSTKRNIGIVTNNDLETYASLIACWFLGYGYVPINLYLPQDRNKVIIREADIEYILSSSDNLTANDLDESLASFILTSGSDTENSGELIIPSFSEGSIAYIIFTSGSTGIPKGVPVTQANLMAFIENFFTSGFDIECSDRCLQMFELTFDVSISSFLLPLLRGACVFPVGGEGIRYIQTLKYIQQYQLTSIQIVPSIIRLAAPLLNRFKFPSVRNCILTGEASSIDLIPEWQACVTNARIFNFYGPTEAAIFCSFYRCSDKGLKNYNGMLAIGKPMGNTELLILDEDRREVDVGSKGELYIGGSQLSKGYLNSPSQSSESFLELADKGNRVFYKSGDMVYMDGDGEIYYCGRFDNQVKIQGFRVELGEIEFLVRDKFRINNVVVVSEIKRTASELILILESGESGNNDSILNYLRHKLPQYMVPAGIIRLKEFPLTSSGKTDRRKIKELISVGVESI